MKNIQTGWYFKLAITLSIVILFSLSIQYTHKTLADSDSINISTSPDRVLFQVENMKPGDWAVRTLTIQNRGTDDFTYNSEAKLKSGSEKLYNEFLLTIDSRNTELFSGKLRDFTGFEPRLLKSLHEEDLTFTVRFPTDLGNEFQGLQFEVELLFVAEGQRVEQPESPEQEEPDESVTNPQRPIDGDAPPKEGDILPATATDSFTNILIGVIMILFGAIFYAMVYRKRQMAKRT